MFYKLMNGDIIVDIINEIHYVKYLSKSQRWINTDAQSANGILNTATNTIYHISGRSKDGAEYLVSVNPVLISEAEYNQLSLKLSGFGKENESLHNKLNDLRQQLDQQSDLLLQILSKL